MYRRLKNILGVSLMALAVVISQIPMPESQAVFREMTESELQVDDASAHVVTFSMNGGTFKGDYNDYSFRDKTPVLVIDDGRSISSFPDDRYASYSGYRTEADTWYTDQECLTEYDAGSSVTKSITLYKKWYNITTDGTELAEKGFHISADGTVLYRYDGEEPLVEIPASVTTIADGAFEDLAGDVRGIVLPAGIRKVEDDAFQGMKNSSIVYLFDSDTASSKDFGKQLADRYEQLVYSDYLDPEKTEAIAGISYLSDTPQEEGAESPDNSDKVTDNENGSSESDETSTTKEEEDSEGDDSSSGSESTKPAEGDGTDNDSNPPESSSTEGGDESKPPVIEVEPDEKFTVTFDTGIADVDGEKREVLKGETISELVSIDGDEPRILRKGIYQIKQDDKKQETVYTFKGWYKDNACTAEWDFSENRIEKDTTLYAGWDRQTRAYFYVTYSVAQGDGSAADMPDRQKLYEDEKLEKPASTPSIANKTFKGWYTSASGGSEYTSWGKPVTADLTLYARFEGKADTNTKTNTVTFHMNGGGFTGTYNGSSYTNASSLTAKITAGQKIAAAVYPENGNGTSNAFQYSGFTTDTNWYKDKECLEAYKNDTALNGDITLYKKWYHTSSGFTMNSSDNVLYRYSGSVENVTIPDSVTVIGSGAFASVGGISSIILPDNIAEVKENAFSGVDKISKDIIITGKTEKARNMAKKLAGQYTRLVYEDTDTSEDGSVVITRTATGSIKLGATLSGNGGSAGDSTAAVSDTAARTGTIVLGANSAGATAGTGAQTTVVSQPEAGSQNTAAEQDKLQSTSGSSASVAQGTKTTQKQNAVSASAPKSTQHGKDSTPKTGDPLQYRMLIVCAMFSVGVLLILTGNGKKKRFSAS